LWNLRRIGGIGGWDFVLISNFVLGMVVDFGYGLNFN
jgi:hypothetical protein